MIKLQTIKTLLNAHCSPFNENLAFHNICINTKELRKGDIFIAIQGDNFDGHDFILEAQKNGATAAIVHKKTVNTTIPLLQVGDTLKALGQLGSWKRHQFSIPILAITGSCGKTTTKEMLASILQKAGNTLVSKKSFNNAIGVPLTLWEMNNQHEYVVLEIGANSHGEISYLMDLVKPLTVAAITNAEHCHIEGFGDLDGIAKAKGEILQGLEQNNNNGFAILNMDSPYLNYWKNLIGNHKKVTFGLSPKADIRAANIALDAQTRPTFTLVLPNKSLTIKLPLLGKHNVMNALTASAAAFAIGIDTETIKAGLENTPQIYMRLVPKHGIANSKIIDDTYNAQPPSVIAALDYLASQKGEKIFVFGGMGELGGEAEKWHRHIGEYAKQVGIDYLFACGKFSDVVSASFGSNAFTFQTQDELIEALLKIIDQNKIILIKGSRSTKMENVVEKLIDRKNT